MGKTVSRDALVTRRTVESPSLANSSTWPPGPCLQAGGEPRGSCLALEFVGQGSSPCKVPCSPVSGTAFGWGLGARRGLWACKVPTPSPPLPSLLVLFPYSSQAHSGSHANFLKGRSLLLSAFIFFRYLTSYHTLSRLK